jgi:hypothetical protein
VRAPSREAVPGLAQAAESAVTPATTRPVDHVTCDHQTVRVLASDPAIELIRERGGRLYVWLKRGRCCRPVTTLASATQAPTGHRFDRVAGEARFELYLQSSLARVPDELHVELQRFPRRVEAYWNGCAWVI